MLRKETKPRNVKLLASIHPSVICSKIILSFFFWQNLLKKGGHTEAEPLHFLKGSNPETDRLKVVIRHEDIFSHVYKVRSEGSF